MLTDSQFETLMMAESHALRTFCRAKYRFNAEDAEDLYVETLARAWNSRHTYSAEQPIRNWLFRIAQRRHLDDLRLLRRRPVTVSFEDVTTLIPEMESAWDAPDVRPTPEQLFLDDSLSAELVQVFRALPTEQAKAVLAKASGERLIDTAERTGLRYGMLRSRLHRAQRWAAKLAKDFNYSPC